MVIVDRTYYPLTTGQMILMYSQKYSIKKQVNNVCATFRFTKTPNIEILKQAIIHGIMKFPCMSFRLTTQNGEMVQYYYEGFPRSIEFLHREKTTEKDFQQEIERWSSEPFPYRGLDTCLYRIKLIKRGDDQYMLYFCVCHLIMDAYTLMSYMTYVDKTYQALMNGDPIPDISSRTVECYQKDQEYIQSEHCKNDLEWWDKELEEEPRFTTVNGVDGSEFNPDSRKGVLLRLWQVAADQLNIRIPKETVSAAQEYAMSKRISPQALYILAIHSYLGKVCGTEDVMTMNAVARRATVLQKNAGGTMVNAIPIRTILPGTKTFDEGLQVIYQKQRQAYKHADAPCGVILQNMAKKFNVKQGVVTKGYASVSLTFQPYLSAGKGTLEYTFKREKNGAATIPLYISIMPYDNSGDLWANCEYIINYVDPENIEKLIAFIIKFIDKGVENPEMTLEELTESAMADTEE